ncbi:glutamine synthetase family protein [Temperatibacter marinus]|uniref:Glutamine synthetase family protein n=1 Tax=Temperatibacter marinus TaxID=1456591 RepID=A0AA52H9V8_9PROT|nr:glutamine synthetase family protein [Temperatibacter marinus]WND02090.1 glutamine synthetase family protein [Temperatibacter marinus]
MTDAKSIEEVNQWLKANNIDDIECMVADVAGIARGKSMPRQKFIDDIQTRSLRLPETLFGMTVHGDFALNDDMQETEQDIILVPDLTTICKTPWQSEPTASVICASEYEDGTPVHFAPREILQKVIKLYHDEGWQPIVAPEFEFYLLEKQETVTADPRPPVGMSGRRDVGTSPYSIDSLDEFASYFDDIYNACEDQNIDVDTLIHEGGQGQYEFNVIHGDALKVADQSFLFKRIIRQVALHHEMFASFMASPYPETFGSAMHIHQSVVDLQTGKNIFSKDDGSDTPLFTSYIGGLQKHLSNCLPLLAPYVNSYIRFGSGWSCPTNTHWGRENRSVGLRVPSGAPESRRIENRIAGSDVNPYLAIAASLACGYIGMKEGVKASAEFKGSAYEARGRALPRHYLDGLKNFGNSDAMKEIFGAEFIRTYIQVKEMEYDDYANYLSPWEKKYLMLHV